MVWHIDARLKWIWKRQERTERVSSLPSSASSHSQEVTCLCGFSCEIYLFAMDRLTCGLMLQLVLCLSNLARSSSVVVASIALQPAGKPPSRSQPPKLEIQESKPQAHSLPPQ